MADQNQTVEVTADDLGKKWGVILNQALGENVLFLKRNDRLQEHIDLLTASEAGLVEHIQDLEAEVARLRYQLSATPKPLSPELAEKAGEAREVISSVGE